MLPTAMTAASVNDFTQPARPRSEPSHSGFQNRRADTWKMSAPAARSIGDELTEIVGLLDDPGVVVRLLPLGNAHGDDEVGPGCRAHRRGHLGDERRAVGDSRPPVAVGAQVGSRPQELVEQEAVRRVEFHAVGADLRGVERALDEGLLETVQLGHRGGAAERLARMRQARRAQRDEVRIALRVPAVVDRALMPELQEHGAAGLVHAGHAFSPRLARAGRDPRERRVLRGARMIDGTRLGDDQ